MNLNAVFKQKEDQFDPKACVVEKIIELDYREYAEFRDDMLKDQPFIAEFNQAMRAQGKSSAHCLLLLGEDHEDGVLIDTQAGILRYDRRAVQRRDVPLDGHGGLLGHRSARAGHENPLGGEPIRVLHDGNGLLG